MKVAVFCLVFFSYFAGMLMTGEVEPYTPGQNDAEIKEAMERVSRDLNGQYDDDAEYSLVEVKSASKQIVAGTKYVFKLEVTDGSKNWICDVDLWYQIWDSPDPVETHTSCHEETDTAPVSKRDVPMPGAPVPIEDMNDEGVQGAIREMERQRNTMVNSIYYQIVTDIGSATSQVVNGIIYRFNDVTFVSSTCTQEEGFKAADSGNLDSCEQGEDAVPEVEPSIAVFWSNSDSQYSVMEEDN